ncbi:SLAC1 family transporter [Mycoplasmopsis felifaucium]|uniref:SLAC1 family transporter n=1 Tax=Mycoplasmopsis felifaucium TaxID=35768 RepID=UPI0004855086|nr:hypothetical protein [Mycoplasmopsis felifaucium]
MNIRQKLSKTPLAVNTVALGSMGVCASLTVLSTNIYKNVNNVNLPNFGLWSLLAIHILCISICVFYLTLLTIKYCILGFQQIKTELNDPTTAGPVAVSLLVLCTLDNSFGWIYTNFINNLAIKWWLLLTVNIYLVIVVFFQFAYFILFLKRIWFKKESWKGEIFASWFVPLIGISITPGYVNNLGDILPIMFWQIEWFVGFIVFIIMYPLVLYKFLFHPHAHKRNIPSMAIYSSPANMLSIGFLVAFDPQRYTHESFMTSSLNSEYFYQVFAIIMFTLASLSVCLFLAIFTKSMMLHKYSYSWGSLTFPSSISATGCALYAKYLFFNSHIAIYWTCIAFSVLMLSISFAITLFVNIKYAIVLNKIFRGKELNEHHNINNNDSKPLEITSLDLNSEIKMIN